MLAKRFGKSGKNVVLESQLLKAFGSWHRVHVGLSLCQIHSPLGVYIYFCGLTISVEYIMSNAPMTNVTVDCNLFISVDTLFGSCV